MISEVADQVSNQQIETKVLRWLNMSLPAMVNKYRPPFLHVTGATFNTAAGTPNYNLATDLQLLQHMWNVDNPIWPETEGVLMHSDPQWNTQQGDVTNYVLYYRTVYLYKVPSGIEAVYYSYWKNATEVVADKETEYDGFPGEWHPLIVQNAIVRGCFYDNNQQYGAAVVERTKMEKEMRWAGIIRPDLYTVMGSAASIRSKPPYPRLPSNFSRP